MKKLIHYLLLVIVCAACKNSAFLDEKPDQALVIPQTLDDLQNLMDNDWMMNGGAQGAEGVLPSLGEAGSDDYYIRDVSLASMKEFGVSVYQWAQIIPSNGIEILDWDLPYRAIFYANVVLDGLEKITPNPAQQSQWNMLKGSALFYRAFMFFQLSQVFAPVYDAASAETDPGLPLRLHADVGERLSRATLKQTYDQIFQDLSGASQLLPKTPSYKTQPSSTAVSALLARISLILAQYPDALQQAELALADNHSMMNYNNLDTTLSYAVKALNPEVIFHSKMVRSNTASYETIVSFGQSIADSIFYSSYTSSDLRRRIFFRPTGNAYFTGSYAGTSELFAGLATDELMLIRSECLARQGDVEAAMQQLNDLLITRWKTDRFVPFKANTPQEALAIILAERRKELTMRGLRWSDLRRLNNEQAFAKTLTRTVNGQTFTLPPNDPRYTYPIPDLVISLNPSLQQNPR